MKHREPKTEALGFFITDSTLDAALLRSTGMGIHVVKHFSRMRVRPEEGMSSLTKAIPGLKSSEDADFTLEIGSTSAVGEPNFLASEFGSLENKPLTHDLKKMRGDAGFSPYIPQMRAILQECEAAGYAGLPMAFCNGASDVSYIQVKLPSGKLKRRKKADAQTEGPDVITGAQRRQLLQALDTQFDGTFKPAEVGFLPLAPYNGQDRFLAVVSNPKGALVPTLESVFGAADPTPPSACLADAEVSHYIALVRRGLLPDQKQKTALVRVGTEDTFIVFMQGRELLHYERIRSLTSFDSPDTICSRVLLQQDEKKVGDLQQLYVHLDGRSEHLIESFKRFFPDAEVSTLGKVLEDVGITLPEEEQDGLRGRWVSAVSMGVRILQDWDSQDETHFNLLPSGLLRSFRKSSVFAWHTIGMLILLFLSTAFFSMQYVNKTSDIERHRAELQTNPVSAPVADATVVQSRIDSLQFAYQKYTQVLSALDSLLIGSDRWTRMLEKTSASTHDVSGIWINSWVPQPDGATIRLEGNALSQARIVKFTRQLEGSIDKVTSARINDIKLYNFSLVAPMPSEMPEFLRYLREQTLEENDLPVVLTDLTTNSKVTQ